MKNSNKWIEELKKLNKENLISVVSYDTNRLLILLKEINFYSILDNSSLVKKMQKKKLLPIYLTEEYIRTSCDVYPLEYLKMKKNYDLVYGKNILAELDIPPENIRLESEQKIKGVLIRITQVILEEGNKKKKLARTAFLAMEDIMAGIEGMLEIAGQSASPDALPLIGQAEKQFSLDLQPFKDIATWKNGSKPEDIKKLMYDFYEKIEELAYFVDKMETS